MGWTTYPGDHRTTKEIVREELEGWSDTHKIVGNSGRYYALRLPNDQVIAVVVLAERRYGELATKIMDESVGPNERNCPDKILDMLTPLDELFPEGGGGYAREWRADCRANNERKRKMPTVKAGDRIVFAKPITFQGGQQSSEMVFVEKFTFRAVGVGRVRLPKQWKTRYEWQVV